MKEKKIEKKKKFNLDDYDKETQEEIKKLVMARIKTIPSNVRISIG